MADNTEKHYGHGGLWLLWALVAGIGGLVVYAKMKPETEVGKHVNGLCSSLGKALRRYCPRCRQVEAEPEGLPAEGQEEG